MLYIDNLSDKQPLHIYKNIFKGHLEKNSHKEKSILNIFETVHI